MLKNVFPGFKFLLLFVCVCSGYTAFAQQGFLLKGVIFHRQNGQRVANALVSDKNNKITVASSDLGWFSIKVNIGDTVKISKKDYTEYFYVVADQKDIVVQMSPVIQLNEVRVVGQTKKQELDGVLRQYRSQGSFYNGKPPISTFSPFGGSPITGLYELFGKTPKQAKHFQEFSQNEIRELSVDKRFNKNIVKQVGELKDEQVQPFMDSYRPSFEAISAWNDYDLIDYIKKSAQGFKEGKALPPLKKLY